MINYSSSFFAELFSFIGKITIQQKQSQYYIDHHEGIDPVIIKHLAIIHLGEIDRKFRITLHRPIYLAETIHKKTNDQCNKK